jgi:RNA polymerase sigma-70 factor (ECF subfamily)
MLSAERPLEPDTHLIARIARGDSQALAELYDRHSTLLYSLILRIVRSTSDAQDVLQETLLLVWRRAEQYDAAVGSPAAWLVGIARHRAIDRWRANGRVPCVGEAHNPEGACSAPTPDVLLAQREQVTIISSVLERLPAEQRELIELAFFEGFTHAELADRCGLPLGTVKSRLRAGLTALRPMLTPRERLM